MKPPAHQDFRPLFSIRKNKKLSSTLSIVLTLIFLNLVLGCRYYTVRSVATTADTMAAQIDEFNKSQQYAVMHSGPEIWHLSNLVLNEDKKTISGIIQAIGPEHIPRKMREQKRVHRFNKGESPLNEIHFYISTSNLPDYGSEITIPFSEINSMSVNHRNTGRMIGEIFFGTIGVIAGVALLAVALKSSCPFVYVKDGEEFIFTGELYPGILTANQQRDDYLPLPNLEDETDEYRIKITNELKEIQYTDLVQLMEIHHSPNVQILLDKNGAVHTFSDKKSPNNVWIDNTTDNITPVMVKDNNSYLFDSELDDPKSIRGIELQFSKPIATEKAKLFLTVKNSLWLDYVFGKFNAKFGSYYPQFQKDQQLISGEKSLQWINDQHIPLSVYLKTDEGWELLERIQPVGPLASRDIAIPIDLSTLSGTSMTLKLETGFMFWEVDYAAIDYTENAPITVNYLNAYEAIDEGYNDITELLSASDQDYFVQPNIGDEAIVTFRTSELTPGLNRTFFLKNRGYYNYIRDYKGKPDFQELKLFRAAGAFTDFSKFEYEALMDYENQFDLALQTK